MLIFFSPVSFDHLWIAKIYIQYVYTISLLQLITVAYYLDKMSLKNSCVSRMSRIWARTVQLRPCVRVCDLARQEIYEANEAVFKRTQSHLQVDGSQAPAWFQPLELVA